MLFETHVLFTYTTATDRPVNGAVLYEFMQWNNKCCLTILTATNIRCQAHHSFNKMDSFLEAFEYLLTLKIIVVGSCTFFFLFLSFFFCLVHPEQLITHHRMCTLLSATQVAAETWSVFTACYQTKIRTHQAKNNATVLQWTLQTENAILLRSQSKNAASGTQNVLLKLFNYKCMSLYRLCLMSAKVKPLLPI